MDLCGDFNVLQPIPGSLQNKFDLVHVRAAAAIVRDQKTAVVFSNLLQMLKPGGWLQWEDINADEIEIAQGPGLALAPTFDHIIGMWYVTSLRSVT